MSGNLIAVREREMSLGKFCRGKLSVAYCMCGTISVAIRLLQALYRLLKDFLLITLFVLYCTVLRTCLLGNTNKMYMLEVG